jgi:uncharacterized membrane protein YjfL (UPF0719 family)
VADEPAEDPPKKEPSFLKSAVARAREFLISSAVLLVVAFIFEHATSNQSLSWVLDRAIAAQSGFTNAVASLNPLHLFQYWYEAFSFIGRPLGYLPEWFVDIIKYPARLVIGFIALCALPIVVIREGSPFEWVLVSGFYLPMFFWLKSQADDPQGQLVPGRSLAYAFIFTLLFYWIVQLILNATLVIFHDIIATARLAVGGSIAVSTVMWALGKRGEHTVTERVLQIVTRKREG